jgi:hypothetical protein
LTRERLIEPAKHAPGLLHMLVDNDHLGAAAICALERFRRARKSEVAQRFGQLVYGVEHQPALGKGERIICVRGDVVEPRQQRVTLVASIADDIQTDTSGGRLLGRQIGCSRSKKSR